jgi:hypothetical protein
MCPVRSKGKGRKTADPLRLTPYGFFGTGRGGLTEVTAEKNREAFLRSVAFRAEREICPNAYAGRNLGRVYSSLSS